MPVLAARAREDAAALRERISDAVKLQAADPTSALRRAYDRRELASQNRRTGTPLSAIPQRSQPAKDQSQADKEAEVFFARPVTQQRMRRLIREEHEIHQAVSMASGAEALYLDRLSFALTATTLQVTMLRRYLRSDRGRQVMEEVRLDSIARTLRGKEPYDLMRETVRRVLPTVRALTSEEIQRRYRERRPTTPMPHRARAAVPRVGMR